MYYLCPYEIASELILIVNLISKLGGELVIHSYALYIIEYKIKVECMSDYSRYATCFQANTYKNARK